MARFPAEANVLWCIQTVKPTLGAGGGGGGGDGGVGGGMRGDFGGKPAAKNLL